MGLYLAVPWVTSLDCGLESPTWDLEQKGYWGTALGRVVTNVVKIVLRLS